MLLKNANKLSNEESQFDRQELFELAEIRSIEIMDTMISQKKLAEDVGFDGAEVANLAEAFSEGFDGST